MKFAERIIEAFLRLALAAGFLSAVADRFGCWSAAVSVWGNWSAFVDYTGMINPWLPASLIGPVGWAATVAEVVLAVLLIIGYRTEMVAKASGILLLLFALAMTFSTGVKRAFDYSVFSATAGAFALSLLKERAWRFR